MISYLANRPYRVLAAVLMEFELTTSYLTKRSIKSFYGSSDGI